MADKTRKFVWSEREVDILLDEILIRKDVLFGAFNTNIRSREKQDLWKDINQAVTTACPQGQPKEAAQTKRNSKMLGGRRCLI